MAQSNAKQYDEIREVLINAVEVELAAARAAVSFMREWAEQTSQYVKTASKSLSTIRSENKDASQVLLEVVDASRETLRTMTELPRKAAERFVRELDAVEQKRPAPVKRRAPKEAVETPVSKEKPAAARAAKRRARAKP